MTFVASTLKSQRGKAGGGIGPEETLIAAQGFDTYNQTVSDTSQTLRDPNGTFGDALPAVVIAAPLSHESNPNSNMAGRRREDDENLVVGPLGGGNDGIGRRSEDDPNLVIDEPYTFDWQAGGSGDESFRGKSRQWIDDKPGRARALVKNKTLAVHAGASVRRLTPTECERLQDLPDGWTRVPDSAPDSRRYAGLGDAVTASVGEWIGRRILEAS